MTMHDSWSTTPDLDERLQRILEARRTFRTRNTYGLTSLLEERPDLRGVHALADFMDDAVRWTA